MRKLLLLLAFFTIPGLAASPAVCYAVHNITTIADWNNTAYWSKTSSGTGDCAASGGATFSVEGVATTTLSAGVPGAYTLYDRIIVNTGITVHVAAGLGIQVGYVYWDGVGDGLKVHATSSSVYGSFLVDAHAALKLYGGHPSATNYGDIDQYAYLYIAPGAHLYFYGMNAPILAVSGLLYVGCGDQTAYPEALCGGNAGGWTTASVASTLNITAVSALPNGLTVNDMVELDPTPQRTPWAWPYTGIDGVTPPPAPPIMPTTNDTGTSPMRTCGAAATCEIPMSTQLCVVATSGLSVSLGWPQGGTPAEPWCTGTETAMAITSAGKGPFWLKKPAFLWGPVWLYTWNSAYTYSSISAGWFDATRSILALPYAPVSNLAQTGPGRKGDSSLTFAASPANNLGAVANDPVSCNFDSISKITGAGCYINYDLGAIWSWLFNTAATGTVSYYVVGAPASTIGGGISVPSGTRTYNEIVVENADVRYIYKDSYSVFLDPTGLDNSANRHFAFQHNTVKMSSGVVGFSGLAPASGQHFEITENSIFNITAQASDPHSFVRSMPGGATAVDVSNNYSADRVSTVECGAYSSTTAKIVHTNWTITNNLSYISLISAKAPVCQWPGVRVQSNRVIGAGWEPQTGATGTAWGGAQVISALANTTDLGNPGVIDYNYIYGAFRIGYMGQQQTWHHNYFAYAWHHSLVGSQYLYSPFRSLNVSAHHNIFVHSSYDHSGGTAVAQGTTCLETNFVGLALIDNMQLYNNTCLGMGSGVGLGDVGDNLPVSLAANLGVHDNIFGLPSTSPGMLKTSGSGSAHSPYMSQSQQALTGYNSLLGSNVSTQGVNAGDVNNIGPGAPSSYNRNTWVVRNGATYNTDATRNVLGVSIQNPSYTTSETGSSLDFTYNSTSDMTLAWALNGSTYGAATQLNWSGAGVSHTLNATTPYVDPGVTYDYLVIQDSATPYLSVSTSSAQAMPTSCPAARWLTILPPSAAAGSYMVATCCKTTACVSTTGGDTTGVLEIVPKPTVLPAAGDTYVILNSEVRLMDADTVNYVDAGIDARALPTSTQTDTAIALNLTDYCSSATTCKSADKVTGLPAAYTGGATPLPLIPVAMPELGGSAEDAFNRGYYEPLPYSGWKTNSSTRAYLGAVAPKIIWQQPGGVGNWPTVY